MGELLDPVPGCVQGWLPSSRPQPCAQHSPATPSMPLGWRNDVHPRMDLEPRLHPWWEYQWKGSPWRLGKLGETPPHPCGRAALGSPYPLPAVQPTSSLSWQNSVERCSCSRVAVATGRRNQEGMQDPTPITLLTLDHSLSPPQLHCWLLAGGLPPPRGWAPAEG